MIVKDSSLSIPVLIRYVIMSSRVQIAVEIVAFPSWINVCALFSHTSVPCDKPEIRIRSDNVFGFVSTTIWITKSVPNSGIPRHPTGHPPISEGLIPRDPVSAKSCITPGSSKGISVALNGFPVSCSTSSSSILIIVGSSCPRISSFSKLWSIE